MPIFEYSCLKCGSRFEKLLKSGSVDGIVCPGCGSDQVEKEFSVFATGTSAPSAPAAPPGCSGGG